MAPEPPSDSLTLEFHRAMGPSRAQFSRTNLGRCQPWGLSREGSCGRVALAVPADPGHARAGCRLESRLACAPPSTLPGRGARLEPEAPSPRHVLPPTSPASWPQDSPYGADAVNMTSAAWNHPPAGLSITAVAPAQRREEVLDSAKRVPLLAERSSPVPLFSAGHPTGSSQGQQRTRLTPSSRSGRAEEGASRRGGRDSGGKVTSPGSHRSRYGALGLNQDLPAPYLSVLRLPQKLLHTAGLKTTGVCSRVALEAGSQK